MPGLGTIINVVLLVAGGLLGLAGGRFITPRIQDTLMKASGLCVLFIGLGGTMQKMLLIDGEALATTGTTMLIVSFALGSLIGEAVNLEAAIENLGEWLKRKTGSEAITSSPTLCLDFTHRVYRCHGYRGINPRRPARRLVHARPQGSAGLHHRLHHDGAARTRLHLLGPARSRVPGDDHVVCRRALPHHDRNSPQQPFARRLHAHLLRRRQPHPSSDLPHGQYAPLRRHRRHLRPPVLNLSTHRYLEHLFDAVL